MNDKPKVQFHYNKSNLFRVIHADGAWGGLTPDLNLFVGFYSQRPPIPNMTVQPLMDDGTLGEEIREAKISKAGIVREMEAGIVLSESTVDSLIEWLQQQKKNIVDIKQKKGLSDPRTTTHPTVS